MGGIIYVCGFYGAGKSTFIHAVLYSIEELKSLPTFTTRPPRAGEFEDAKLEFHFVTKEEYDALRLSSRSWDHTEIGGAYYGTDAEEINRRIDDGEIFIVASPNTVDKLKEMQRHYSGRSQVVWINTDLETSNKRLLERDGERAVRRISDPAQSEAEALRMKAVADVIFKTTSDLEADEERFKRLVLQMIGEWE